MQRKIVIAYCVQGDVLYLQPDAEPQINGIHNSGRWIRHFRMICEKKLGALGKNLQKHPTERQKSTNFVGFCAPGGFQKLL